LVYDLVVTGGTVVSGSASTIADIAVNGGLIAEVAPKLARRGREVVDATGCYVLPGIVDPHVHPIHAESMQSVSTAAVFGGVTTVLHHVYTDSSETLSEAADEAIAEGREESLIDFGIHLRITDAPRRLREIDGATQRGVTSFKVFTAYRERGLVTEDADLLNVLDTVASAGGLTMVHAENAAIVEYFEHLLRASGRTRPDDYPASRPPEAEAEALFRVVTMARVLNAPIYLVHVSSAQGLAAIAAAKAIGQEVYTETCPHYLALTVDALSSLGVKAKIAPPLRSSHDVDALWTALSEDTIHAVGSDHSAFSEQEKRMGSSGVFDAGFGAPGIETMLPVLYQKGVVPGRIRIEHVVRVLAERPAQIFGLTGKGKLLSGKDADIVVFDPRQRGTLPDGGSGRAYYSLYAGLEVEGAVTTVIQRGRVLLRDSVLMGSSVRGSYIGRDRRSNSPVR
jgi:dihydropyrimidinase